MSNFFNPMYPNNYMNRPHFTPPSYLANNSPTLPTSIEEKSSNIESQTRDIAEEKILSKHLPDKPLLEFHGIKLYSDDVLILLLIFFLYKENINDMLLFIALFSLLF